MPKTPPIRPADATPDSNEPYCSNCGYTLTDLTDSARCPECGRPFVEVLTRAPRMAEAGRRYRSESEMFGLPIIHVAFGPKLGEARGRARGIIAVGDDAFGFIAIGGAARGIVAIGGGAVGVASMGGGSIGLLTAMGGGALGGFAVGGAAAGGIASGGGAIGFVAQGGGAAGYYARGGGAAGFHTIGPGGADPEAQQVFNTLSPAVGAGMNRTMLLQPFVFSLGLVAICAAIILVMAWFGHRRWHRNAHRRGDDRGLRLD